MNESQIDDLVERLSAELIPAGSGERAVVEREGPSEMGRAFAQGMTFGGADEAEAWLRSQFNGEDYDAALTDIRGKLSAYRDARPGEAVFTEIGGAALPSLVAAVLSGGGSSVANFPMLARVGKVLGIGAAEGGGYAFNTGEGGFGNRLNRVPGGMVLGAAGAGVGAAVGAGAGATLRKLTDVARRKMGARAATAVERAIRKAAEDGGMSVQQAVDDVLNGRILADNKTIASVARAWRAQSAEAEEVLRKGVAGRPDTKRAELLEYLQKSMGAEGNALRAFTMDDEAARAAQGASYNKIFQNAGQVDDATAQQLADAYRRVPSAAGDLDKLLKAQTGNKPFYTVTDDGVQFARNPTLEEAEIMRRGIDAAAQREFRSGSGAVGGAYRDVEKGVRSSIDAASPDLAATRQQWSALERAKEAFAAGQKSMVNPDQAAMDFQKYANDDAMLKAYRAGVTHAMRQKASTGARKSLPRNIVAEETREGQVFRMAMPEDNLEEGLRLAKSATDAQDAANIILGGSPTAITQGRVAEQGLAVAEGALDAASGNPVALVRLAGQAVKAMRPGLSPKEAAAAAKLVVETDPNIVARALTDRGAMDALYNLVDRTSRIGQKTAIGTGGAAGGLLGSMVQ